MVSSISQKSEYSENSQKEIVKQRKKWEFHQTKNYYEFLLRYRSILEQTEKKQKQRIYNRMSDCVGSRSTHQCRSHHQKVMKRYGSIDNFIAAFRRKLQSVSVQQKFLKDINQGEVNEKKKERLNNKTKQKLKQSSSIQQLRFNIQQELRKLIQNTKSPQTSQKINKLIDVLKKIDEQIQFNQDNQNQEKNCLASNDNFMLEFYQRENRQSPFNCFQNSLQYKNLNKGDSLLSQQQINALYGQKIQINGFSTVSNDQNNTNYQWIPRLFSNPNHYGYFYPNFYPQQPSQKQTPQFDYSYAPLLLKQMAAKTLAQEPQKVLQQGHQTPQQIVNNAPYICASIIQNDNLNNVNQYIRQNNIILTPNKIQMTYKNTEYFNTWVQCVKVEEPESDGMVDSQPIDLPKDNIQQAFAKLLKEYGRENLNSLLLKVFKSTPQSNISLQENDSNKKQVFKSFFAEKQSKREEHPKFTSSFEINHNPYQFQKQNFHHLEKKIFPFTEQKCSNSRLEAKLMNQQLLPKTAPSQEDAKEELLKQKMEMEKKIIKTQQVSEHYLHNDLKFEAKEVYEKLPKFNSNEEDAREELRWMLLANETKDNKFSQNYRNYSKHQGFHPYEDQNRQRSSYFKQNHSNFSRVPSFQEVKYFFPENPYYGQFLQSHNSPPIHWQDFDYLNSGYDAPMPFMFPHQNQNFWQSFSSNAINQSQQKPYKKDYHQKQNYH